MELPHLGKHCSKSGCNKLDFLPIKCDACDYLFCDEHYVYSSHDCQNSYKKNNQVPVCPLCNIPIPIQKGQHPDYVVGAHIDSDCQSDPAKNHRKVFTNKCSYKKCKTKEVIPVICKDCSTNFCLKHRHPTDHNCEGKSARNKWVFQSQVSASQNIQGSLSEDEALARALAMSMQDNISFSKKTQEELDLALARQLQASEAQATTAARSSRDRCNVS
ncbi:AN1-type zinc finger protein 2A-like [Cylas formicarius]|uniref:AN1-type zinc finger protein 2A-like n=1 Tax=Cylas formicarius TaxID=197179 RepID=UPI002958BC21|nr:AN1-type zinc finger protein 2A-like [Cylas formicarius]